MAYNLKYRMEFGDIHHATPASFRVDFLQKDGVVYPEPIIIRNPSDEPLFIERSPNKDDVFLPTVGSTAAIAYEYDGTSECPLVEEFVMAEEYSWMVNVYRNGKLYWKGFIVADSSSYPWLYPPYTVVLSATDAFDAMKGIRINLDDNTLFKYDKINLGEFFNRTLFHALGYDDVILRVLFNLKPNVLPVETNIIQGLYVHTDAFYDFNDGPLFVYDALVKWLGSVGARMFYSDGMYWIQRIADMDQSVFNVIDIKPSNLSGEAKVISSIERVWGDSVSPNDVYYQGLTQEISFKPGLKEMKNSYKLQAFNKALNFDWQLFQNGKFDFWPGPALGGSLVLTRNGFGTIADPYRVRFDGGNNDGLDFISQNFRVAPGQFVGLQVRAKCNYTTGMRMTLTLIPTGGGKSFFMDSSGSWSQADVLPLRDHEILLTPDKKTRTGTTDIESKQIPNSGGSYYDMILRFVYPMPAKDPSDPVPPGESVYNDLYPVFVRVYNTNAKEVEEKITNDKKFSLVERGADGFFLDLQDDGLSNTIFTADGPLPVKSWTNLKGDTIPLRSIDETLMRNALDQAQRTSYVFSGTVYSNTLDYHTVLVPIDKPGVRCMQTRVKYNVRECSYDLRAVEIHKENTSSGIYEAKPIIKDR